MTPGNRLQPQARKHLSSSPSSIKQFAVVAANSKIYETVVLALGKPRRQAAKAGKKKAEAQTREDICKVDANRFILVLKNLKSQQLKEIRVLHNFKQVDGNDMEDP